MKFYCMPWKFRHMKVEFGFKDDCEIKIGEQKRFLYSDLCKPCLLTMWINYEMITVSFCSDDLASTGLLECHNFTLISVGD